MTISNNKVGRPLVEFTDDQLRQISTLAQIGCSDKEIYSVIGVSKATFIRLKDRDPRVQAAIDLSKSELAMKLRRYQIELACSGSVPMLIHLGKSLLKQGVTAEAVTNSTESPLAQFLPRAETIKGLPAK